MQNAVKQHLIDCGLSVDSVVQQLPQHLTLSFHDGVLSLSETQDSKSQLSIDFDSAALIYRSQQHLGGEHLIKACQLKGQKNMALLDTTCGLGIDAFLLSQSGFVVTACEKHPVIHALLKDGLRRYEQLHEQTPFALMHGDSIDYMKEQTFDVIYLDPMFPTKKKSAKNKKGMQVFQDLHQGSDHQIDNLIQQALQAARKRVVIKRPVNADFVTKFKPTFQILGKTCRFDAYQLG